MAIDMQIRNLIFFSFPHNLKILLYGFSNIDLQNKSSNDSPEDDGCYADEDDEVGSDVFEEFYDFEFWDIAEWDVG